MYILECMEDLIAIRSYGALKWLCGWWMWLASLRVIIPSWSGWLLAPSFLCRLKTLRALSVHPSICWRMIDSFSWPFRRVSPPNFSASLPSTCHKMKTSLSLEVEIHKKEEEVGWATVISIICKQNLKQEQIYITHLLPISHIFQKQSQCCFIRRLLKMSFFCTTKQQLQPALNTHLRWHGHILHCTVYLWQSKTNSNVNWQNSQWHKNEYHDSS